MVGQVLYRSLVERWFYNGEIQSSICLDTDDRYGAGAYFFYNSEIEVTTRIIEACFNGSACCVELTNRGDQAHIFFEELTRRFNDRENVI